MNQSQHPPRTKSFFSAAEDNDRPNRPPAPYRPPRLMMHGSLGPLIRGASWKGTDSIGELGPEQNYPG